MIQSFKQWALRSYKNFSVAWIGLAGLITLPLLFLHPAIGALFFLINFIMESGQGQKIFWEMRNKYKEK